MWDGYVGKGRPNNIWMNCVKDDRDMKRVNMEMPADRGEHVPTPHT